MLCGAIHVYLLLACAGTSRSTIVRLVCIAMHIARLSRADWPVADVNPIGAISKTDLKKFIAYARDAFELPVLTEWASPLC